MSEHVPSWVQQARDGWTWRGAQRPPFAKTPGPDEESVWDYPRPPLLVADAREVIVRVGEVVIARTTKSFRVLETSHPPTFYLPRADVDMSVVSAAGEGSFCEWKGACSYFDVEVGAARFARVAWSYEAPFDGARVIAGHLAFYAHQLECFVGGARVVPQPGGFYGGWITPELVGPFKGESGTSGW
jgi:uncharacterized protein (DUF427 family)